MIRLHNLNIPILAFIILIFTFRTAEAARNTAVVESLRGEKWWGIFVSGAPMEPFLKPFKVNTAQYSRDGLLSPMLISSEGRYIWSRYPMEIAFDGKDFTIGSDREKIEAVKGGKNLREAYLVCCHKNFPPSGSVPGPELFTLPVYNTRMEFGYVLSQEELLQYADRILSEGLPAGIILLSDGWRSYNGTYDFDREYYPAPKAMTDRLHKKGFKLMLTITPFSGAFGRAYTSGLQQGYFLRKADGKPLIVEADGGFSACFNPSNREEADMLRQRLDFLRSAYGVDGFRFDCRALMPRLGECGEAGSQFMSRWLQLGKGTSLCEYLPGQNTPLAPYVNCIENNNGTGWESLRLRINDILAAGLTGFPYSHISAHRADTTELFATPQLMVRTLQLAAVMPVANIAFAPWRITDPQLFNQVRQAVNERARLGAYIAELVQESARTAEPLVRHMEYQFPRNGFSDCDDQFMLGGRYLFAPALSDEPTRTVRLPRGIWTDGEGKRHKGPLVIEADLSGGRMAWYELAGKDEKEK